MNYKFFQLKMRFCYIFFKQKKKRKNTGLFDTNEYFLFSKLERHFYVFDLPSWIFFFFLFHENRNHNLYIFLSFKFFATKNE